MDDDLKPLMLLLLEKVGALSDKVDRLDTRVEQIAAEVAEIRSEQGELRTQVAVIQLGQDELRQVTSANHFRMMGRINQLSDQLTAHLIDHHGLPQVQRRTP